MTFFELIRNGVILEPSMREWPAIGIDEVEAAWRLGHRVEEPAPLLAETRAVPADYESVEKYPPGKLFFSDAADKGYVESTITDSLNALQETLSLDICTFMIVGRPPQPPFGLIFDKPAKAGAKYMLKIYGEGLLTYVVQFKSGHDTAASQPLRVTAMNDMRVHHCRLPPYGR